VGFLWVWYPVILEAELGLHCVFPFPVLSRDARERLFCLEANGVGAIDGRQGKVMGVGSNSMLTKSAWYSGNCSSTIFGWTGHLMSSHA
jgi:hypothetical protein